MSIMIWHFHWAHSRNHRPKTYPLYVEKKENARKHKQWKNIKSKERVIVRNRRWKLTSRNISELVCFPLFEGNTRASMDLYNVRITRYRVAINVNRYRSHCQQLLADLILLCHARYTNRLRVCILGWLCTIQEQKSIVQAIGLLRTSSISDEIDANGMVLLFICFHYITHSLIK